VFIEKEVIVVHLSMIPKFLLGPGYSIKVTHRSGRKIQLERNYIPEAGETIEQALALLVFGIGLRLDEISDNEIPWYKLGMEYKHHLPWEIEKKKQIEKYESMPRVSIEPEWLKMLILQLRQWRDLKVDGEEISFTFNGEFLVFRYGSSTIPLPATGKKWQQVYYLKPEVLELLPKRIYKSEAYFYIDEMDLKLSGVRLPINRRGED
jgi:hypothetical protein